MDFSAFSHGQVHSKLWLCEELEKYIKKPSHVAILASWYSLTGFLLLARNATLYSKVTSIDYDFESTLVSEKINNAWQFDSRHETICCDVNNVELKDYDIIVCTSTEDILETEWFSKIPNGKLICLQSLNLTNEQIINYDNWDILNPNTTFDIFKNKFPLSTTLYEGTKEFDYGNLNYTRYMIIGIK